MPGQVVLDFLFVALPARTSTRARSPSPNAGFFYDAGRNGCSVLRRVVVMRQRRCSWRLLYLGVFYDMRRNICYYHDIFTTDVVKMLQFTASVVNT